MRGSIGIALFAVAVAVAVAACGGEGPPGGGPDAPVDADPGVAACPWIADKSYAHPSDVFFEPDVVVRLDLEIAQPDWDFLLANPDLEEYRPVSVTFCGQTVSGAGLRFKRSSHPAADLPDGYKKNPMLIHFDEFGGERLRGLRHINLEYYEDRMLVAERMNWEVLRGAGVTASRVNSLSLRINGEIIGVFTNVERVNKSYLARHFAEDDGNLYKHQYCGTFVWEGPDPAAYTDDPRCYEKRTNETAADYGDLIHLIDVANNTPDDQLEAALPQVLDIDGWIRLAAALQTLGYGDTPNANGNNFYSYHAADGRFRLVPWDLDSGFFDPNAPCEHPADTIGWDIYRIGSCHAYLPLFQRVIARPAWRQAYNAAVRDVVDGPFAPATWTARADALAALLAPDMAQDPNRNADDAAFAATIVELKSSQQQRVDSVNAQLP
jgi:hypothetical protein